MEVTATSRILRVLAFSAEQLSAKLKLRQHGRSIGTETTIYDIGRDKLPMRIANDAEQGRAQLTVKLADAAGDRVVERFPVRVPAP